MGNKSSGNRKKVKSQVWDVPINYELWDFDHEVRDINKALVFKSPNGRVRLHVKDIDRDLIPDDFMEAQ